jgi:hypothetical protein
MHVSDLHAAVREKRKWINLSGGPQERGMTNFHMRIFDTKAEEERGVWNTAEVYVIYAGDLVTYC